MKKIAFCSDHAGFEMKQIMIQYMKEKGYEPVDFGTFSEESCDYPDFAHPAALAVERGECDFGIGMCGSGEGISMTLNKHQHIRAALCWMTELASLARRHNDANFLTLPARFIAPELAKMIADTFVSTDFEGGRHQRRIDKIPVDDSKC